MQRALLLLLVAASYLLLAGGRTWTLGPLLGLAAAAALVAPTRTFSFPANQRPIDLALIAVLAGIALQLVPLPAAVTSVLSPHAASLKASLQFTPLGAPASAWLPLSVNPRATWEALATTALGIVTFWTARELFTAGGSTRAICRGLAFLGALAAVMAMVQRGAAPRTVLFLVEPEARSANPFGAFVNRNHFAAWMLLVAAPVAGYCIARWHTHPHYQRRWRRSIGQIMTSGANATIVAVFLQIGALLMTMSRSAIVGLGVAAVTGWRLGASRMRLERTSLPAVVGGAGALVLLVVLFVDVDRLADRFAESVGADGAAFSRTTIWRESLPIARDFWLTGSGAGTYSDAMTKYQQSRLWVGSMQRWAHFNNAHSHYVQVAAEGGLLLGVPALLALIAAAVLGRRAVRADKGEMFWVRVGAAAGLAGLAAQSVWEVALIMPANAVMAGVAGGLMLYRRDRGASEPASQDSPASRPTPPRLP